MPSVFRTAFFTALIISYIVFSGLACWAYADQQKRIVVGTYNNEPLLFESKTGEMAGLFVDVLEHIAEQEQWRIVYLHASWAEQIENLKAGKIDLLADIIYSPGRAKLFDFNKESVLINWGQVYVREHSTIQSVMDLRDKKIAVVEKDIHSNNFKELIQGFAIDCQLIELDSYGDVFHAIHQGKVDAGVVNQFFGLLNERKHRVQRSSILFNPSHVLFAAPKNKHPLLLQAIDTHLARLKSDKKSAYYHAMEKWLGSSGKENDFFPWIGWFVGSVVLLLLLVIIISLWLRRQVAMKTAALQEEIKERKHFEGALKTSNERLEQTVAKRTQELTLSNEHLKLAKEQADQANQYKSQFLANMSHEIRTPMNAIIGLTEIALKGELSPRVRDYLRKVLGSSRTLLRIINDILDFSKIEAGKMELERAPFHLIELFENMGNFFRQGAVEKNIELVLGLPPNLMVEVVGDSLRLQQVLVNLVGNALKFTKQGEIVIHAKMLGRKDNTLEVLFSVRDSGMGISDEQLSKLFQPFTQADSSISRKYGGTGLGLTICKRLIEMMGGRFWAESELGKGTAFHFTVTLDVPTYSPADGLVFPEDMRGIKTLIVEDNPASLEVVSEILKEFGLEPVGIGDGEQAISLLREAARTTPEGKAHPFDLILMDWRLPGMDGLETSRIIRKDATLSAPKILLLSALSQEDMREEAQESGLDGYLEKPVSRFLLFDTVMEVFGKELSQSIQRKGPTARERDSQEQKARARLAGSRILLAEDHLINQEVAREILQGIGLLVEIANHGKEALSWLEREHFDGVLMDLQMPEMDGYEATRQIRSNPAYRALPIIAMTAHAISEEREKCFAVGMNDHVSKPIDTETLFATLLRWLPPRQQSETTSPFVSVDKQPESEMPDYLEGIDVAAGLQRVRGNTQLYCRLLLGFKRDYADMPARIQHTWEETEDFETAARMTHTVKGLAGNIAAMDLFDAARVLEVHFKKPEGVDLHALFFAFNQAMDRVTRSIQTLETFMQSKPQPAVTTLKSQEQWNLVDARACVLLLKEYLDKSDGKAERTLERLKELLPGSTCEKALSDMEKSLDSFDFSGAQQHLVTISKLLNESSTK